MIYVLDIYLAEGVLVWINLTVEFQLVRLAELTKVVGIIWTVTPSARLMSD